MELLRRFIAFVTFVLVLLRVAPADAQSDVRTPDQKVYFPQMDPVLIGMWEGHNDGTGMRFDAEAIACMMRACAAIQATVPKNAERCLNSTDPNCRYTEVRDSRSSLYKSCYSAHLARVAQPGYTRLTNPPPLTSLVCSVIAAQKHSTDERIYTATNGHPRQRAQQRPPTAKTKRSPLRVSEANALLAELNSIAAATPLAPPDTNTFAVQRKTYPASANETTYGGQIPGFRIVSQDEKEAVLIPLPGADYYTVQRSFLAKDYETDSVAVMAYAGNDRAQIFFPYLLTPGKIELYKPRLRLKGDDIKGRLGPIDADTREFVRRCADGSCEARFALQAGETLRLPRKSSAAPDATVSSTDSAEESEPTRRQKPEEAKASVDEPSAPPAASADMEYVDNTATATASTPTIASATPPVPPETVASTAPTAVSSVAAAETAQPPASTSVALLTPQEAPDASITGAEIASAVTTPKTPAPGGATRGFLDRNFLPIVLLLCTALVVCIVMYSRRQLKSPPPNDNSSGSAPNSEPQTADPAEPDEQTPSTLRPSFGGALPPDPNPPGTFTPVPVAKVSEPKAKVVILLPGGSGPNEPTIPSNNQAAATAGQSGSTATGGLDPPKAPTGST